jgi:hypothetical protein
MTGLRVRQGGRVGIALAVLRYTAVVQWEGTTELDVAWLNELELIGYDSPVALSSN